MGTRVLLLPGAGCPSAMYNDWMRIWREAGLDASTVVYPRHGLGEDPSNVTPCQCEEYVESLVKERGKKERPVFLVGHSFGGLVAARVAMGNAQVKGLILVAPAPPQGIFIGMVPFIRLIRPPFSYLYSLATGAAVTFRQRDTRDLFLNYGAPVDISGVRHEFQPESGTILRRLMLNTPVVDPDEFHCPVHVFAGSEDHVIEPWIQRKIAAKYGAQFHLLPGSSHMPMFDSSSEHVARVLSGTINMITTQHNAFPSNVVALKSPPHRAA